MAVPGPGGPGWPQGSVDPRVPSAVGANGLIGQVPPMPCQGSPGQPGNPTNPGDFAALGCNPKSLPVANATNVTVNVFNQPMSQPMLAALQQILGGNFPTGAAGTDGLGRPQAVPAMAAMTAPAAPAPLAPPAPPAPQAPQAPPAPPAPGVLQAAPVISSATPKSQGAGLLEGIHEAHEGIIVLVCSYCRVLNVTLIVTKG